MKNIFLFLLLALQLTQADARNLLKYKNVVNVSQYKGYTFLALMTDVIKPRLDDMATNGFRVADGKTVVAALKLVDAKVANRAVKAAGGVENLRKLADRLNKQNELISFYDLPEAIEDTGFRGDKYGLSTFLALVSGGGVAVQFDANNISYNVNYGTGEFENDERTGRSFGEAPNRFALDASDKHYLTILENYVRTERANIGEFYKTILQTLLNNDSSNLKKVSPAGQAVASDFLAVYIAEQDRHLMSNLTRHPWDEALLEVTLLSALHSGQSKIMVMYRGGITHTTYKQTPGCSVDNKEKKPASMVDYWQFSKSTDPTNCNRSGINITRKDFRALGNYITAHQRKHHPQMVAKIEATMGLKKPSKNLFAALSKFLINLETPKKLNPRTLQLVEEYTQFLVQISKDANAASNFIVQQPQNQLADSDDIDEENE